jgi:enamine deaminase RidA (YjgF/YER057c/UK114 family)
MPSTVTRLNPNTLPDAGKAGYSQISIVDPSRLAFVSGQVAWTVEGGESPGTIEAQTAIVVRNLQAALDALNSEPHDIVQMRIYVVDLTPETQGIAMGQIGAFLNGAQPSLTGIGVSALAGPGLKIEVEMVVRVSA